ncbi:MULTISPECIES: acyl carrier protein phosphodiesterase [unclassified Agarivorans]|uniref:acyl carrier protein phosphodiesterase n=1 Tax=unclassified Agarivorans TaxID=2636026 RepID=UPI0026E1ABD6|nr:MULTISPECIES: ACP phosphodiesterase [unclassified Agarivorans]MDO6686187.1 ACP phosphodiesterase [Agarivorans sp. 3_MG-2023]MDO6716364.1 ACP phosphodiesterase [Agarivorans sp. 2_MG-2023]
MNYLAHFHIAQYTNTSIPGALLGDFVKGNQWQYYPEPEQLGILLHRHIDSFTDQQVAQLKLNLCFHPTMRRYAGIALDVYFDYLLSQHWPHYHSGSRDDFITHCYQQLHNYPLKERALVTATHMREYDWLTHYNDHQQITGTLKAISRRLRRPTKLELMLDDIDKHSQTIDQAFSELYPLVLKRVIKFVHEYNLESSSH